MRISLTIWSSEGGGQGVRPWVPSARANFIAWIEQSRVTGRTDLIYAAEPKGRQRGLFIGLLTVILVLNMFVLKIPGSRFRTETSQNRSSNLYGPPTSLRFVQTLDRDFRNLSRKTAAYT